jgi:PAS domain S-box-containing protein
MAKQPIDILLVEDNRGDARLLQENLKEIDGNRFRLIHVELLQEALQRLAQENFDLVLLDLSLPDSQGLETFAKLHHQVPSMPVVVLTGLDDETLAMKAMQVGIQDYLIKGQVNGDLLVRSIHYAIERQKAEQKIREQAALLDIATDAILVRSLENKILFWNKGAERLYGWSKNEAIERNPTDFLFQGNSDQIEEAFRNVLRSGYWQGELVKFTKKGKKVTVSSRWTLVRDEANRPKSILTVDTDITEKKQLEAQFLHAQRLESLGTLASGIAHDLNNILTPILAAAQLLPLKLRDLDERSRTLLKILEENSKRGSNLVRQILSFARGAEGKRVSLQISHLLMEVIAVARQTFPKSIEVNINLTTNELWTVLADPTQLHQVFMNLCVNARDAMPNGGTLSLTVENVSIDENYARSYLDACVGPYLVITVEDTGVGIPQDILGRIFEPFFTTKEPGKGTGLGLSTVLGIVKSHGGFVSVDSELGRGTWFKVHLPAVEESKPQPAEDETPLEGNGELILVVDDEPAIREVTKVMLETHNYQAITASDTIEAIALYAERKKEIYAVAIDLMMPSLDTATTIRILQKIDPQVRIVLTSGLSASEVNARSMGTKVRGFLAKPFTDRELLKILRDIALPAPESR